MIGSESTKRGQEAINEGAACDDPSVLEALGLWHGCLLKTRTVYKVSTVSRPIELLKKTVLK